MRFSRSELNQLIFEQLQTISEGWSKGWSKGKKKPKKVEDSERESKKTRKKAEKSLNKAQSSIDRFEKEFGLNEISPKTKFDPGGFKGILTMAEQAGYAIDNLETKFAGDPPEELYTIQRFVESMKKAAMWQIAGGEAAAAMHQMPPEEYTKQVRRVHTPAYKRDKK